MEHPFHVGDLLSQYFKKHRLFKAAFYRDMNMSKKKLYPYFTKADCKISMLYQMSKVLNHNFLQDIANTLPSDMPPKNENKQLLEKIEQLQNENQALKVKLETYKELLEKRG